MTMISAHRARFGRNYMDVRRRTHKGQRFRRQAEAKPACVAAIAEFQDLKFRGHRELLAREMPRGQATQLWRQSPPRASETVDTFCSCNNNLYRVPRIQNGSMLKIICALLSRH